ncbi:extracellular solute-binding protein [Alphaproteobacteria bacterium]|nr:extracellular solute-binding protein [Alphaproteobacteria bacterium]
MFMRTMIAASSLAVLSSAAYAGCGISAGSVRIGGNDFPAIQAVASAAAACDGGGVMVSVDLNKDHKDRLVASFTANPAEFSVSHVSNSTLVSLLNDGLALPLDGLVAKHGGGLQDMQMITIDGKIMAVAFMANAQHLFYRKDILDAAGVGVPTTYEEVLAAAKAIKSKGLMDYPVAGTYKAGWNLGEEFVNMYLGHGGEFFKPGTAEVSVNNAKGVATLNMMKSLSEYMNPDFLTHDSNAVQAEWEAGNVALTNLWGSRAGAVTDGEGSTAAIESNTMFAAAPTVAGGSIPSTTLWWDGFAIAKNASAADAEATFQAMMAGISPKMAAANADAANWLIDGAQPRAAGVGVVASASGGASPYPMLPFMGALHGAAGAELADFLQGNESAEQTLADIEAAYTAAAKEKGFL